MPRLVQFGSIVFTFWMMISCQMIHHDIVTPQFEGSEVLDERRILLKFDTPVVIASADLIGHDVEIASEGAQLTFAQPLKPGQRYELVAMASDERKNTTEFKTTFYGHNPNPAQAILNEFTTLHSKKHKERIELYITKSGNLAGLTLFIGQPYLAQTRFVVLPNYPVRRGQLVTLQLRSPSEKEATKTYDFLLPIEPAGLPNVRGILVMMDRPQSGKILDAVAYIDGLQDLPRTFERQFQWLVDQGQWVGAPLQICGTTPTRSILRKNKQDSHQAKDWYVVKTGGANFSQDLQPAAHEQNCQ